MKRFLYFILCCLSTLMATAQRTPLEDQLNKSRVRLPNGWHLSPAGRSLKLGDLPLNLAVSPSKKWIAVTNNGQSVQSIQLIDTRTETVLDNVVIPKSWYGLKFSADEKFLYASGGNDNRILKYEIIQQKLQLKDSIILGAKWPAKISPAGIEIDDAARVMYVVTKEDNALYVISLVDKKIIYRQELGTEAYSCLLSPKKDELYISLWGGDKVLVFDTRQRKTIATIAVGDNPNELLLTKKGIIYLWLMQTIIVFL